MRLVRQITQFFFNPEDKRNSKAYKHIAASLGIRAIGFGASLLMVPLILEYIGSAYYGIWLTISSIIIWIGLFDIGLGSGLRNKLAEAISQNDIPLAKNYISTGYCALFIISLILLCIFLIIHHFLNWTQILNVSDFDNRQLRLLIVLTFMFFLISFNLKLVGVILLADQRPAINNLFDPLANILALIIIIILKKTTQPSLLFAGISIALSPVIILALANFYFYKFQYKQYIPLFRNIRWQYFRPLFNLGIKFFIIQISIIIIFTTDNIIITQIFNPSEVTVYNIAYKYFGIITMIFTIYITPFWSAFTDAWVNRDLAWIKKTMKRNFIFWLLTVFGTLIFLGIAGPFYKVWVGDKVTIPFSLTLMMAFYVIIFNFTNVYNYFINGTGKIKLQLYINIFQAVINIPLAIYFAKYLNMGLSGIILATIVCLSISVILAPWQYYLIINGKSSGIWNK